jgi:predicted small metal-binding protein
MKSTLTCKDMGIDTCSFEVKSENRDEIKDALFAHATKYHPEVVSRLSDKEKADMAHQMDMKMT